jgi:hypothetical protein
VATEAEAEPESPEPSESSPLAEPEPESGEVDAGEPEPELDATVPDGAESGTELKPPLAPPEANGHRDRVEDVRAGNWPQ